MSSRRLVPLEEYDIRQAFDALDDTGEGITLRQLQTLYLGLGFSQRMTLDLLRQQTPPPHDRISLEAVLNILSKVKYVCCMGVWGISTAPHEHILYTVCSINEHRVRLSCSKDSSS